MLSRIFRAIGSFIFWSHERGSWQYDLMVALILAFVFLTPRSVFHDRPTLAESKMVMEVRDGDNVGYRVEARVLEGSKRSLERNAEQVVEEVTGRAIEIREIQPVLDAKGRVQAYTVWIRKRE